MTKPTDPLVEQRCDPALAERAAIVAWLRRIVPSRNYRNMVSGLANSIERGDHDYPDIQRLQLGDAPKSTG